MIFTSMYLAISYLFPKMTSLFLSLDVVMSVLLGQNQIFLVIMFSSSTYSCFIYTPMKHMSVLVLHYNNLCVYLFSTVQHLTQKDFMSLLWAMLYYKKFWKQSRIQQNLCAIRVYIEFSGSTAKQGDAK